MTRIADDHAFFGGDARTFLDRRTPLLARALLGTILAVILIGTAWTAWAKVEEIVRASGRVIPVSRTKIINHPQGGRVAAILVRDGDRVSAGATLLRLDASVYRETYAELRGRYQSRVFEVARLQAEVTDTLLVLDAELAAARPDLLAQEQRLMRARAEAAAAERETLEKQVKTRESELDATAADIARITQSLMHLRQQLGAVRELTERGLYPRLKLMALEKQVADAEGDLAKAQAGRAAAQAALEEGRVRLEAFGKEHRKALLADLAQALGERDRLKEQLDAQLAIVDGLSIRAPVSGIIEDLKVTSTGQSVGANEPMMRLVPIEERLVIEARVANEDVGRLAEGQTARVKVQAFDYLRHGVLTGTISKIAADATPEPQTGALSYAVTVVTKRNYLGTQPGKHAVAPGMLVDVEIEVGERTILSYFTDRLWRLKDEAFRDG